MYFKVKRFQDNTLYATDNSKAPVVLKITLQKTKDDEDIHKVELNEDPNTQMTPSIKWYFFNIKIKIIREYLKLKKFKNNYI